MFWSYLMSPCVQCQRRDWPRHKQFCAPTLVKLTSSQARGVALTAARDIQPGTRVFQVIHYYYTTVDIC